MIVDIMEGKILSLVATASVHLSSPSEGEGRRSPSIHHLGTPNPSGCCVLREFVSIKYDMIEYAVYT